MTTRHTWNKAARAHGKLLVPENELYELLQVIRRRLIRWVQGQAQHGVDTVLQTALQVSSSTTGSSAIDIDMTNRWASLSGVQSEGRYAVASTRTAASKPGQDGEDPGQALSREMSAQSSIGEVASTALLGVELDIQIGQMTLRSKHLQALSSNVANRESSSTKPLLFIYRFANPCVRFVCFSDPDVKLIFGENTMQASLLERAENRRRYRLVGLGHEVEVWPYGHGACPPLGEEYDREYDPSEMQPGERWIAKLFEPVRKSFFNGPSPPPMQFSMAEKIPADAEVAVLIGLHHVLGGPFKLVWVQRRLKCVQIFECVSQGRQWWFTQHMTTDCRYSLRELQPSFEDRKEPYPKWWERGAGSAYPKGVGRGLANNLMDDTGDNLYKSVIIKRDAADSRNLSGGVETFVPKRLLLGVVPQSILDSYLFWQDEALEPTGVLTGVSHGGEADSSDDDSPAHDDVDDSAELPSLNPGYRRLRGYPREDAKGCEDTIVLIEFQTVGSWDDTEDYFAVFGTADGKPPKAPTDKVDVTRMPGRTLRVTRLPLSVVKDDIDQRKRLAACLEPLQLLVPPVAAAKRAAAVRCSKSHKNASKASSSRRKGKRKKKGGDSTAFKVGTMVEFDTDGSSKTWVQAEVLKVHPRSGGSETSLYDVDPKEAWVGRQTRVPGMFLRALTGQSQQKVDGQGVWIFDGLSDSEDEEWNEEAEEALERERVAAKKKKAAQNGDSDSQTTQAKDQKTLLTFDQLDRLQYVLAAVGGDEPTCVAILRRLAADPDINPFTDVRALGDAVAAEAESAPHLQAELGVSRAALSAKATWDAENIHDLLNLVTAPRRSRLHSLLKTLVRVENASHILAWVKRSSIMHILNPPSAGRSTDTSDDGSVPWAVASASTSPWWTPLASCPYGAEYVAMVDCPAIDLVELPRLKLSFTVRKDYTGMQREL